MISRRHAIYPYSRRNMMRRSPIFGFNLDWDSLFEVFDDMFDIHYPDREEECSCDKPFDLDGDCRCKVPARIFDEGENTAIEIEIPGFTKEEVKISVKEIANELLVELEATKGTEENKRTIKSSYVLKDVEESGVTSKLENGILRIVAPKKEEPKSTSKEIPVE